MNRTDFKKGHFYIFETNRLGGDAYFIIGAKYECVKESKKDGSVCVNNYAHLMGDPEKFKNRKVGAPGTEFWNDDGSVQVGGWSYSFLPDNHMSPDGSGCPHEWVNIGFNSITMACKKCGMDMPQ